MLADIWSAALRIDRVGINDNYFALGGDSLTSISIALEIARRLGGEVSLWSVMQIPTIAELALLLESQPATPCGAI